jgi:hypothetical protein
MMSTENEIRAASAGFYAALNRMAKGEAGAMESVWSHSADVTALHPIGGRKTGGWRVAHHHTDVSPAMLDVLARLKAAA